MCRRRSSGRLAVRGKETVDEQVEGRRVNTEERGMGNNRSLGVMLEREPIDPSYG